MYSLTICFGPTGTTWALMFKEKETANGVFDAIHQQHVNGDGSYIQDDFGQRVVVSQPVHGIVLEDLDVVEHAHIERQLANARMQFKAQERAKTDPIIRQAMGAQQRAPILQPMGNGRFGS